jgi:hypothetical protein
MHTFVGLCVETWRKLTILKTWEQKGGINSKHGLFNQFGPFQFLLVAKNDIAAGGGGGSMVSRTFLKFRKNHWLFWTWFQEVSIRGTSGNGQNAGHIAWTRRGPTLKGTTTNKSGKNIFHYWLSPGNSACALTFRWLHITWNEPLVMQLSQDKWIKGRTWRKETTLKA